MARYAIGDLQGCYDELRELLDALRFSSDRDQLVFTGDLVNRGPDSLKVLRFVRAMAGNAVTVLGNHDLHLLAHHYDPRSKLRRGDTLDAVLKAPDREALAAWLLQRPLAIHDPARNELLIHAGLVPQWTAVDAASAASEASQALQRDPENFLKNMYGNEPDQWRPDLKKPDRLRFTINVLTRLRFCTADGRVDLKLKEAPDAARPPFAPWFKHRPRKSATTRVIFGHWSTLGYYREPLLLCLDTGCVWGGALTALNLDDPGAEPVRIPCRAYQAAGGE
ncbi:MAG: symmetrical bis(5'-nucleosyl)-tetraphosphatase [Pseudomonadota bacterium]